VAQRGRYHLSPGRRERSRWETTLSARSQCGKERCPRRGRSAAADQDHRRFADVGHQLGADGTGGLLRSPVQSLPAKSAVLRVEVVRHSEAEGGSHDPPRGHPPSVHPPSRRTHEFLPVRPHCAASLDQSESRKADGITPPQGAGAAEGSAPRSGDATLGDLHDRPTPAVGPSPAPALAGRALTVGAEHG